MGDRDIRTKHQPNADPLRSAKPKAAVLGGIALAALATQLIASRPAHGASEESGLLIARAACGGCHATGRDDASPLPAAPPFRELNHRYPAGGGLMDLLSRGMIAMRSPDGEGEIPRHPFMPQVMLDETQIGDLAAYIQSIQTPRRSRHAI